MAYLFYDRISGVSKWCSVPPQLEMERAFVR